MQSPLLEFIQHARSRGVDTATVRVMLTSAGWKERDVATALAAETLQRPIPIPSPSGGPREFFRYLLTFAALWIVLVNLVLLFFGYLELLFPDAVDPEWGTSDPNWILTPLRWSLATVLVAFPLFLLMSRSLLREIAQSSERSRSAPRRVFTWLNLLLAAVTALFNLITLLFYYFEGELSLRFVLKVVVLFLLTGLVFAYYSLWNRLDDRSAS